MREEQLYISDLDGTLLQPDGSLSEFSKIGIGQLLDAGVQFTIATARSITSTKEILGDVNFRIPVICSNGGSIYDYGVKRPIHIEYIPKGTLQQVLVEIKDRKDTAFVSCIVDGRERLFYDEIPNEGMLWYYLDRQRVGDKRLEKIDDIRECGHLPVIGITFMNRRLHLNANRKFFARQFKTTLRTNFFENKYSPGWYWLSLHSPLSNKATAIGKLLDICSLRSSRLTVFGDEANDAAMFEQAHHAVAVSNALPGIRKLANQVIGANHEDAVVRYLLEVNGLS